MDGAAAMVIGREEDAAGHGAKPLARLAGMGVAACDPQIMGWGPVPAVKKALKSAGVKGEAVDHVELNEAFAPQALACIRDFAKMGIDPGKVNPQGGALALGHPPRRDRSRAHAHLRLRAPADRQEVRRRHDVHRRRPGDRPGPRGGVATGRSAAAMMNSDTPCLLPTLRGVNAVMPSVRFLRISDEAFGLLERLGAAAGKSREAMLEDGILERGERLVVFPISTRMFPLAAMSPDIGREK